MAQTPILRLRRVPIKRQEKTVTERPHERMHKKKKTKKIQKHHYTTDVILHTSDDSELHYIY